MKRKLQVAPIAWADQAPVYDGIFVTLGYEERARHLATRQLLKATKKVAWAFDHHKVLSFDDNRRCFTENGFEILDDDAGTPTQWLSESSRAAHDTKCLRVAVDISSMTRRRMALWVEAAAAWTCTTDLEIDFWYSMARFTPPPDDEAPNVAAGPVLPSFAGWATDPGAPTALILGLGYERDQAIGAVEYIEPAEVLAFDPSGTDVEYARAIQAANAQLWSMRPKPPRRVTYDPGQAFSTFLLVEGLLVGLARRARPVLLPFGPKVFSLVALLAAQFHPACAVWRVSSGAAGTPVQRTPTGQIVGLRARFYAVPKSSEAHSS